MKQYKLGCIVLAIFSFMLLRVTAQTGTAYKKEIQAWDNKRIESLKAEDGWLNLTGLLWLNEGKNNIRAEGGKLIYSGNAIKNPPAFLERKGNTVRLVVTRPLNIKVNGLPATDVIVFHPDSANTPRISYGSQRWTIIKREDKIGVRMRDLKSPLLSTFKRIERFPADTAWRVTATLETGSGPEKIAIRNVLGQTSELKSPGKLVFSINNKTCTLVALEEGEELFVIFADATNADNTYPSGRFVYANKPGPDGKTILDFNKAFNPPCAFTNYATCPLPPKQNRLPVAVTAGEKRYGHH